MTAALVVMAGTLLWQERRAVSQLDGLALAPWAARLAIPSILAGLGLLAGTRSVWLVLGLIAGVFSFMLVGDRAFLAYFQQPLSAEMAVAFGQLWDVSESTSSLVSPIDWAALVVVMVCFFVASRNPLRGVPRLVGLALALSAVPATSDALSRAQASGVAEVHGQVARRVARSGLTLFHLDDVLDGVSRRLDAEPLDQARRREVLALFARRKALNARTSPLFGIAAGRNVVQVQIEAFQHFLLDWEGPDGAATPVLRGLAEHGLSFDHMMDTTRMGRTSSAEFQVLTGMPSHTRELAAYTRMGQTYTTLPSTLVEHGYSTWSMHAFRRDFWNRAVAHPTYGIQHMLFADAWAPGKRLGWGLGDMDFLVQVADKLASVQAPFFAHVITLSCHHPFQAVPKGMLSWDPGLTGGEDLMAAGYLRLARYTDQALGAFMSAMQEHELSRKTLFVLYGDHDAGLDGPSRESVALNGGPNLSHPAEDRVPCVILVPGQEQALSKHGAAYQQTYVGLHDIPATVLHLLGIQPPTGILGTHAFVPQEERDVMPLFLGGSVVAAGQLLSGWDLPSGDPDVAAMRAAQRAQAHAVEQLIDDALDYALQSVAAELSAEELAELAALPTTTAGSFAGSGSGAASGSASGAASGTSGAAPPPTTWRRTDIGEPSPLPLRVIDALPRSNATLFQVQLVLRNEGQIAASWTYAALDGAGDSLRTLQGTLAPGEQYEVRLAPVAEGAAGTLGLLDAPNAVRADVRIQRAIGVTWRRAHAVTYPESRWIGSAHGIASLAVVLTNASDTALSATTTLRIEGVERPAWNVTVPPRSKRLQLVDVANESGEISVVVQGPGLTADLLAWDQAGTTLR